MKNKSKIKNRIKFFTLFSIFILALFFSNNIQADETQEIEEKIQEYKEKINNLEQEEINLKKGLDNLKNKEYIKELEIENAKLGINDAKREIDYLSEDIEKIDNKLGDLESKIAKQQEILQLRKREEYKIKRKNNLFFFLENKSFSNSIKDTYSEKKVIKENQRIVNQLKNQLKAYNTQDKILDTQIDYQEIAKNQLNQKQAEATQLKAELEALQGQQINLIEVTQNEENKFRDLLEAAEQELVAAQNALAAVNTVSGIQVKKGDVIGLIGNTGCSTAAHLHLEIYKDGVNINPATLWGGIFSVPLKEGWVRTQDFGQRLVPGMPQHRGEDYAYSGSWYGGEPIYAITDGTIYYWTENYVCSLSGTRGKWATLVSDPEGNTPGYKFLYGHLQ